MIKAQFCKACLYDTEIAKVNTVFTWIVAAATINFSRAQAHLLIEGGSVRGRLLLILVCTGTCSKCSYVIKPLFLAWKYIQIIARVLFWPQCVHLLFGFTWIPHLETFMDPSHRLYTHALLLPRSLYDLAYMHNINCGYYLRAATIWGVVSRYKVQRSVLESVPWSYASMLFSLL